MNIPITIEGILGRWSPALRARRVQGLRRLRAGAGPAAQAAVATLLAWYAADFLLGQERPLTAAIAAVISFGAVSGQTLRRAVEWIFGVSVGLTVAGAIMATIGSGPVQTAVMVGLAMSAALLLRGGIMFWTEAGVSALLVAHLDPTTYGTTPDRFLEALVGGAAALAVAAAFPGNPAARVSRTARPALEELATTHRDIAAALHCGDLALCQTSLSEARRLDERVAELQDELDGGSQIARFVPSRRRHLHRLNHYSRAAGQLDLAVRNTRVLARAAVSLIRERGDAPEALSGAVLQLARSVEALREYLERPGEPLRTRHFARAAAREATG